MNASFFSSFFSLPNSCVFFLVSFCSLTNLNDANRPGRSYTYAQMVSDISLKILDANAQNILSTDGELFIGVGPTNENGKTHTRHTAQIYI